MPLIEAHGGQTALSWSAEEELTSKPIQQTEAVPRAAARMQRRKKASRPVTQRLASQTKLPKPTIAMMPAGWRPSEVAG